MNGGNDLQDLYGSRVVCGKEDYTMRYDISLRNRSSSADVNEFMTEFIRKIRRIFPGRKDAFVRTYAETKKRDMKSCTEMRRFLSEVYHMVNK